MESAGNSARQVLRGGERERPLDWMLPEALRSAGVRQVIYRQLVVKERLGREHRQLTAGDVGYVYRGVIPDGNRQTLRCLCGCDHLLDEERDGEHRLPIEKCHGVAQSTWKVAAL